MAVICGVCCLVDRFQIRIICSCPRLGDSVNHKGQSDVSAHVDGFISPAPEQVKRDKLICDCRRP